MERFRARQCMSSILIVVVDAAGEPRSLPLYDVVNNFADERTVWKIPVLKIPALKTILSTR